MIKILCFIFIIADSYALQTVENSQLGNFEERLKESSSDPLDYIFKNISEIPSSDELKKELTIFRGFYEDGIKLANSCKRSKPIYYGSSWQKEQAMRAIIATLQYIGLDLTTRAIAKYSDALEYTDSEYSNLVDNLVGGSCSRNISIISQKQLKKNLFINRGNHHSFKLPTIEGNPLFPQALRGMALEATTKKRELLTSLELFRTFCSWGGEVSNLRLMVPLIRHPIIFALIKRQLTKRRLDWQKETRSVTILRGQKTVRILCDNFICRRTDDFTFNERFPRSIGTRTLQDDLERLYCKDFRNVTYQLNNQPQEIIESINKRNREDENLLTGQLISLLTGVPDFFVGSEYFGEGKEFLRFSMDKTWDNWATLRGLQNTLKLEYEEPLSIELVDTDLVFNSYYPEFKISFDYNLGEYDRIDQLNGKIKIGFQIKVTNKLLKWVREKWLTYEPRFKDVKIDIYKRMNFVIDESLKNLSNRDIFPPFTKELRSIIIGEILNQITLYKGKYFDNKKSGITKIPVTFNFGLFALKYNRDKYLVKKNVERDSTMIKILELGE